MRGEEESGTSNRSAIPFLLQTLIYIISSSWSPREKEEAVTVAPKLRFGFNSLRLRERQMKQKFRIMSTRSTNFMSSSHLISGNRVGQGGRQTQLYVVL